MMNFALEKSENQEYRPCVLYDSSSVPGKVKKNRTVIVLFGATNQFDLIENKTAYRGKIKNL